MAGILALTIFVLDIVAIVDLLKSSLDTGKKTMWIILIILLPLVGMLLYFLLAKK